MSERIIAVTGFPRSGTSLMMRMLHVGGVEVVADNQASYETERANVMNRDFSWIATDCPGKAVKLLEPQYMTLPAAQYDFIWCRRNAVEQGKSQVKLLRTLSPGFPLHARADRMMTEGIERDTARVQNGLQRIAGSRQIEVWFEKMLARPLAVATALEFFLDRTLKKEAMAAEVRERGPGCYPGMLEMEWTGR